MAQDMRSIRVRRIRFAGLGDDSSLFNPDLGTTPSDGGGNGSTSPIDPSTGLVAGSPEDVAAVRARAQAAVSGGSTSDQGPILTPAEAGLLSSLGTGLIGAGATLGGAVLRGTTAGGLFQSGAAPKPTSSSPGILASLTPILPYAAAAGLAYLAWRAFTKKKGR